VNPTSISDEKVTLTREELLRDWKCQTYYLSALKSIDNFEYLSTKTNNVTLLVEKYSQTTTNMRGGIDVVYPLTYPSNS